MHADKPVCASWETDTSIDMQCNAWLWQEGGFSGRPFLQLIPLEFLDWRITAVQAQHGRKNLHVACCCQDSRGRISPSSLFFFFSQRMFSLSSFFLQVAPSKWADNAQAASSFF